LSTSSNSFQYFPPEDSTAPILVATDPHLPIDSQLPDDCYKLTLCQDEIVTDSFRCIFRRDEEVWQIVGFVSEVLLIPASVFGTFIVRSISDDFLWFCETKSTSLPDSLREIFGSCCRCDRSSIEIPSFIEVITNTAFTEWSRFNSGNKSGLKISFETGSRLKIIAGFNDCAIRSITIPASVEVISGFNSPQYGNQRHYGVKAVIFESNSRLKSINGFSPPCFKTMTIPDSVEMIGRDAFCEGMLPSSNYKPFRQYTLLFGADSRLREIHGIRKNVHLTNVRLPDSVELLGCDAFSPYDGKKHYFISLLVTARSCLIKDKRCSAKAPGSSYLCMDVTGGLLDLSAVRSDFIKKLISHSEIHYVNQKGLLPGAYLIWKRIMTNLWSFSVNIGYHLCVVEESRTEVHTIPGDCEYERQICSVNCISDSLLCLCSSRSIEIPSFITRITNRVSELNLSVQMIEINESIEIVAGFWDFPKLEMVIFASHSHSHSHSHLREIHGFRYCDTLRRIDIPSSVEVIGINGFYHCTSLSEIIFSSDSHLRHISGFCWCTSLSRIEIPSSVVTIWKTAFFQCTSLCEVNFSPNCELTQIFGFENCDSLRRIEIPASVTEFARVCFNKCRSLCEIVFAPNSRLWTIQDIRDCYSLRRIEIPASVSVIYYSCFSDCPSLCEIVFAVNCCLREIHGFDKCVSLQHVQIPSSVETISGRGFYGCTSLCEIIFAMNSSLTSIQGFKKCYSLRRLEIQTSVPVIDYHSFFHCSSLCEVVFASDCHIREIHGFDKCTSLQRVQIPSSVETIGRRGFYGCTSLCEVIFAMNSSLKNIEGFQKCRSLRQITIPDSVENINYSAFSKCTSLCEVVFAANGKLEAIRGFSDCTSLPRITIPRSVKSVSSVHSSNCTSYWEIIFCAGTTPDTVAHLIGFAGKARVFLSYEDDFDIQQHRHRIHLRTVDFLLSRGSTETY
jgi:hypothetical protein